MGGRRGGSRLLSHIARGSKSHLPRTDFPFKPLHLVPPSSPIRQFFRFSSFSAIPAPTSVYGDEFVFGSHDSAHKYAFEAEEDEEFGKIPVKAYFLCTSINLRSMQAENSMNVIPPTSRSSNYITLQFCDFPPEIAGAEVEEKVSSCRHMVVFQYGSAVLFNIEDKEVDSYLEIARRHASGLVPEMRKDEFAVKEKPLLDRDMHGGPDHIVVKNLDADSIRIIGSVLGQSIALDYFVSQVDGMVEEFTDINRGMEKSGTFTMDRKKLFQLVGKANSNMADVILKVGLFDRSEIAWREAKYSQIFDYLREEYEVTQRFGNLDFKLKFVEHNVHFLQEVLQNRRSDLSEWCIICLLTIDNVLSIYEIIRESTSVSL
ncbi:protein RETARDED ROOT GROWTH, mitochondrial [Malania oleifera]|uniref:protein RETARDED ROOT GROWTH, mitochondrial n=1 Tax=Malania oleifera TaxID=397392 RepID=UPI0025ADAAC5|nr:protein RETARDED ROOT GROWTH, mitochondrial [Malania oleifera]